MTKPESRTSFLNRSFRRSFRRRKTEEKASPSVSPIEAENKALIELRKSIANVIQPCPSEIELRRSLRAKKLNVEEAVKVLRTFRNAKKLLRLENFEDIQYPAVAFYQKISTVIGFDNEGALIRYVNIGDADLKGSMNSISTIELIKIILGTIENDIRTLEEENKKCGRNVNQIVFIVDLNNLSTSHILYKPVLDTALTGLQLFQDYFYEIWKSIFVINAPSYFNTVYKVLRPTILEELHTKIYVYGAENWKEALLLQINADILPDYLGGSRVDYRVDPNQTTLLTEINPIPKSFYAGEGDFLDPDDPAVQVVTVSAGGFVNIPIPVNVSGSILKFHINAKDHDIGIAMYYESHSTACHIEKFKKKDNYKDILSKLEQIVPSLRSQCHIKPEVGEFYAWRTGIYIVHFNNTYSWMNAKQVYYKLAIIPPDTNQEINVSSIVKGSKNLKL